MKTVFLGQLFLVIVLLTVCQVPRVFPEPTKTNFAVSVTSESMTAIWAAKDRGFFQKEGLDMQLILMPRSPLAIAALGAGEIDLAITGPGHLLNAAVGGADIVGVANLQQKLDFTLNARPEIKRPEDLKGKKIAISGPGATSRVFIGPAKFRDRSGSGEDQHDHDSGNGAEPPVGHGNRNR
jgi:ABC-type nitrate/sulfonate/bicarbonate transport system substrate-binding protein